MLLLLRYFKTSYRFLDRSDDKTLSQSIKTKTYIENSNLSGPSERITIEIVETRTIDANGNNCTEIEKSIIKTTEIKKIESSRKSPDASSSVKPSSSYDSSKTKKGFKSLFSDSKSKSHSEPEKAAKQTNGKDAKSSKKEKPKKIKIDYSSPRDCHLLVVPSFDGLGIHISCEPDTSKSPYIHHIEPESPGMKGGLKKGDFILAINGADAVNMDFNYVINSIKSHMETNDLILKVGNEKVFKKWVKDASKNSGKKSSQEKSKKSH
jgi:hypothetical protein